MSETDCDVGLGVDQHKETPKEKNRLLKTQRFMCKETDVDTFWPW